MIGQGQGMLPFGPRAALVLEAEMPALVEASRDPCEHCGQASTLSPHRMDKSKVGVLEALASLLVQGCTWARVETGRDVIGELENGEEVCRSTPYRADQHAMRLTWFGLVQHEKARSARYRITERGWDFLHRMGQVPRKILCRQGVVVFESVERVRIDQVRGVTLDKAYWDAYPWSDWLEHQAGA